MSNRIKQILTKGKAGKAGEPEHRKMLSLFYDENREFDLKNYLLEELEHFNFSDYPDPDTDRILSSILSTIAKGDGRKFFVKRHLKKVIQIAAILILGLFFGFFVKGKILKSDPVYYSATTPRGSISEMILPDSTRIFLNADSKVIYSTDRRKGLREVSLEGEAWFDVANNSKIPFVVHTNYYDVQVTGTKFNIKAYDSESDVITTLEEGEIIIASAVKFKIARDIIIKPGEQVIFHKDSKQLDIKTVNTDQYTSWKDGKLIFVNMSLKDLISLLERKYGVDIRIQDTSLLNLHFDGTIRNESIIDILEVMKNALPVDYSIVGQHIEIKQK